MDIIKNIVTWAIIFGVIGWWTFLLGSMAKELIASFKDGSFGKGDTKKEISWY